MTGTDDIADDAGASDTGIASPPGARPGNDDPADSGAAR
jgi:hypothetical protein